MNLEELKERKEKDTKPIDNESEANKNCKSTSKSMDDAILESSAMANIKKLEAMSKKIINIMDQAANMMPNYVKQFNSATKNIDEVSKYLEIDTFKNTMANIEHLTSEIVKIQADTAKTVKAMCENVEKQVILACSYSKEKTKFWKNLNYALLFGFIGAIAFVCITSHFVNKKVDKIEMRASQIHDVLSGESKYWYDESNKKLLLKSQK